MARKDECVAEQGNATTLGGKTVTAKLLEATKSHEVLIWFCGLTSPELHIARAR